MEGGIFYFWGKLFLGIGDTNTRCTACVLCKLQPNWSTLIFWLPNYLPKKTYHPISRYRYHLKCNVEQLLLFLNHPPATIQSSPMSSGVTMKVNPCLKIAIAEKNELVEFSYLVSILAFHFQRSIHTHTWASNGHFWTLMVGGKA